MKYELAKQLKDAGFPQMCGVQWGMQRVPALREISAIDPSLSVPSIDELMQECGEPIQIIMIKANNIYPEKNEPKTFLLYEAKKLDGSNKSGTGFSAQEAVATLWLELNKIK
jgi:hypothetical protein